MRFRKAKVVVVAPADSNAEEIAVAEAGSLVEEYTPAEEDAAEGEYGSCVVRHDGTNGSKNEEFWDKVAEWGMVDYLPRDNLAMGFIAKLRVGSNIGAYTIVSVLGSGSFGAVFKASDDSGVEVAIKVQPKSDIATVRTILITGNARY